MKYKFTWSMFFDDVVVGDDKLSVGKDSKEL